LGKFFDCVVVPALGRLQAFEHQAALRDTSVARFGIGAAQIVQFQPGRHDRVSKHFLNDRGGLAQQLLFELRKLPLPARRYVF